MIDWSVAGSIGRRVRVNHAVEHATITILSGQIRNVALRGRSNRHGFYVMGGATAEQIRAAADAAIVRLQAGEAELAIHPFCGTNLAITGLLTGIAAATAARADRRSGGYPSAVLAALIAALAAQPLGFMAQKYVTTESNVGAIRVESVDGKRFPNSTVHFVRTSQF